MQYGGLLKWGVSQWMVDFLEIPFQMDDFGVSQILGNPHMIQQLQPNMGYKKASMLVS